MSVEGSQQARPVAIKYPSDLRPSYNYTTSLKKFFSFSRSRHCLIDVTQTISRLLARPLSVERKKTATKSIQKLDGVSAALSQSTLPLCAVCFRSVSRSKGKSENVHRQWWRRRCYISNARITIHNPSILGVSVHIAFMSQSICRASSFGELDRARGPIRAWSPGRRAWSFRCIVAKQTHDFFLKGKGTPSDTCRYKDESVISYICVCVCFRYVDKRYVPL